MTAIKAPLWVPRYEHTGNTASPRAPNWRDADGYRPGNFSIDRYRERVGALYRVLA
jgi:hypothetical protein